VPSVAIDPVEPALGPRLARPPPLLRDPGASMSVTFLVGMGIVIGLIVIAAVLFLLLSGRDDNSSGRRD
jgi:hypothetical protein